MLTSCSRNVLNIARAILGPLQTNCYILKLKKKCVIVDPASQPEALIKFVKENYPNTTPEILLTHGHFDHIMAVPELCKAFPKAKLYASKDDLPAFKNPTYNLSHLNGIDFSLKDCLDKMQFVKDGDELAFDELKLKTLAVPGHSPGSLAFYSENDRSVFSGDTIFFGSVGNTDFPGGDFSTMMKSITEKLLCLPEYTQVFPGHGDDTTIGTELHINPFLKAQKKFS